jgi:hypothetical protein
VFFYYNENANKKGVEDIIKSGDEVIPVHLGPVWFLER